jgi:hypothetical protein
MKLVLQICLSVFLFASPNGLIGYERPAFPFAPAAGKPGSTAVPVDDPTISSWATSVVSVSYGLEVAEEWRIPDNAIGPAGESPSDLLVLGRGGEVVLEFASLIGDGEGDDFVVFENALGDTFLELAFVEVSSDGEHFVRFPAYSLTADPVSAFGEVSPTLVHGLAGKYRVGYGTPFDLQTLEQAYSAAVSGKAGFSEAFRNHLLENFPKLDVSLVRYVRIIDIIGDGTQLDCEGFPIYDPYPTVITAGFDLDAVGVFNSARPVRLTFSMWCKVMGIPVDWEGDADKDKWNNAMEYLLGSNPSSLASQPVLKSRIVSGTGSLVVAFELNPLALELPEAEVSPDGINWEAVEIQPITELLAGSALDPYPDWGVQLIPGGLEPLFFRLKATR